MVSSIIDGSTVIWTRGRRFREQPYATDEVIFVVEDCQMQHEPDRDQVELAAYLLWEQEGRPDGRADEFWMRAVEMHRQAAEHGGTLQDGVPSQEEQSDEDEANVGLSD